MPPQPSFLSRIFVPLARASKSLLRFPISLAVSAYHYFVPAPQLITRAENVLKLVLEPDLSMALRRSRPQTRRFNAEII